jgi:hypothetical protein
MVTVPTRGLLQLQITEYLLAGLPHIHYSPEGRSHLSTTPTGNILFSSQVHKKHKQIENNSCGALRYQF